MDRPPDDRPDRIPSNAVQPIASSEPTHRSSPIRRSSSELVSSDTQDSFESVSLTSGAEVSHRPPFRGESAPSLNFPSPVPTAVPIFVWGDHDAFDIMSKLTVMYEEIVHWRKNCFVVPYGQQGKLFVSELARLFKAYGEGSALESVALKAALAAPALLLQKPHAKSKTKDHISCLKRRLELWHKGELEELVLEGRTIQQRLRKPAGVSGIKNLTRSFSDLMFQGKTNAAVRLLLENENSNILDLNSQSEPNNPESKSVLEELKEKHPPPRPCEPDILVPSNCEPIHPVIFESIDADRIRSVAKNTFGAGGPSGLDARCWRRLCTAFKAASDELCQSLSMVAKRICSVFFDPVALAPLLACRLIALDKNPGVRPIGICEVPRRIIAKAVLAVTRSDLLENAGLLQLCAGQKAGVESAIHAMQQCFEEPQTEGVLLVDASNAFNSINRHAALLNARSLCPALGTIFTNCYRAPVPLFVGGTTLMSEEGTTQGDPLAMPLYALATIPLIKQLSSFEVQQCWYADDAAAGGQLDDIRRWWDDVSNRGPAYGYFPNAKKTWLVVKEGSVEKAKELFENTGIRITSKGRPYLGAPLGSVSFHDEFVRAKVKEWQTAIVKLSEIAESQPHAAYSRGLSHVWSFMGRTTPNTNHLFRPLDDTSCRSSFQQY